MTALISTEKNAAGIVTMICRKDNGVIHRVTLSPDHDRAERLIIVNAALARDGFSAITLRDGNSPLPALPDVTAQERARFDAIKLRVQNGGLDAVASVR